MQSLLLYLLFHFVLIVIPSIAISSIIWKTKNINWIIRILLGYPIALSILFFLALIGNYSNIQYLELLILLVCFYPSDWFKLTRPRFTSIYYWLSTIAFVGISINFFFNYTLLHAFDNNHPIYIHPDLFFHIGNTWSIINNSLPLESIRLTGVYFGPYHLFQNIFHSSIYSFTNIEPQQILLYYEPYVNLLILVGGLIFLPSYYHTKYNPLIGFVLLVSIFFTSNNGTLNSMLSHNFTSPVSFFISMYPFLQLFIYLFYTKPENVKYAYLSSLLILCFINKIILIPVGLILTTFYLLYKPSIKENKFYLYRFLLFITAAIIILFSTIYGSIKSGPFNNRALTSVIDMTGYYYLFYNQVKYFILEIVEAWFIIPFLLFTILKFKEIPSILKKQRLYLITVFGAISILFAMRFVLNFGINNMYYNHYSILILSFIASILTVSLIKTKKVWVYSILLITSIPYISNARMVFDANKQSYLQIPLSNKLDTSFLQASIWLHNHTLPNEMMAHNFRRDYALESSNNHNNQFWSAMSGRNFYLDGFGSELTEANLPLIKTRLQTLELLDTISNWDSAKLIMTKNHIDCFILFKTDNLNLKWKVKPSFENTSYLIVKNE